MDSHQSVLFGSIVSEIFSCHGEIIDIFVSVHGEHICACGKPFWDTIFEPIYAVNDLKVIRQKILPEECLGDNSFGGSINIIDVYSVSFVGS